MDEDAEHGGACVDVNANCPFWAATGECQSNKEFMHVQCKKSCNRCNVVRVKDHSEINKYIAQKQKEINEKRNQRQKQKEVLKVLEGGPIGNTDVQSTTTTLTTPIFHNSEINEISKAISDEKSVGNGSMDETIETKEKTIGTTKTTTLSSDVQRSMITTKPTSSRSSLPSNNKAKKKKIDSETGLECVDTHKSCPFWASTGECKANRTWMHKNCKLSCDRCHVVRVKNQRDINRFIAQKNRESAREREQQKKVREVRRILEGGTIGSVRVMEGETIRSVRDEL